MVFSRIVRMMLQVEFASQPDTAGTFCDTQNQVPLNIAADGFVVKSVVLVLTTRIANVRAKNRKEGAFV